MNIKSLQSIWEEINQISSQGKGKMNSYVYSRYKENHPEQCIKDVAHLRNCYTIYDMYINETDAKIRECMDKIIANSQSSKNIAVMFRKLIVGNKYIVNDILTGAMSLNELYEMKKSNLGSYIGKSQSSKKVSTAKRLKDDSYNPVITGDVYLHQLQSDTDMYIENIVNTLEMLRQGSVDKDPARKEEFQKILITVYNAIHSLENALC